jgi:hypothetical protein
LFGEEWYMPTRTTDDGQESLPDDDDRIEDFFSRHGGPGKAPRRFGGSQGGPNGWSEIEAHDGHVLRCDWSRVGSRQESKYSEVAPTHPA